MTIHIAFAADDNYAKPLAVSIASLLINTKTRKDISIYILSEGLEISNREAISELSSLHADSKVNIKFIKMDACDFKDYPLHTGLHTLATYFRLKLPSLFPDYNRIIYLDSDIVVLGDIEEMWERDLSDIMLMAIEEPYMFNKNRLNSLGMNNESPYFNGGILFLNLKYMREHNFEERSKQYIMDYSSELFYQDQDILNALSEGNWKPLPLKYNAFAYVTNNLYNGEYRLYKNQDIMEARKNPFIIHYNHHPKPWKKDCRDKRKNLYFKYIKYTRYKDFKAEHSVSVYKEGRPTYKIFILKIARKIPILEDAINYIMTKKMHLKHWKNNANNRIN